MSWLHRHTEVMEKSLREDGKMAMTVRVDPANAETGAGQIRPCTEPSQRPAGAATRGRNNEIAFARCDRRRCFVAGLVSPAARPRPSRCVTAKLFRQCAASSRLPILVAEHEGFFAARRIELRHACRFPAAATR